MLVVTFPVPSVEEHPPKPVVEPKVFRSVSDELGGDFRFDGFWKSCGNLMGYPSRRTGVNAVDNRFDFVLRQGRHAVGPVPCVSKGECLILTEAVVS